MGVWTAIERNDHRIFLGRVEARGLDPMVEDAQRAYSAAQLQLGQSMAKNLKSDAPLPEPEGELTFATVNVDLNKEINTALDVNNRTAELGVELVLSALGKTIL